MKNARKGFTLVELLVVVAIIGAISALAITMMGGVETNANETANIANLKRLTSAAIAYNTANSKTIPNNMDSLIRSDYYDGSTAPSAPAIDATIKIGFDNQNFISDTSKTAQILYCGYDADDDFVADDDAETLGLNNHNSTGFGNSLAIAVLTQTDVDNLKKVGITKVYDVNPDKNTFHGGLSYVERDLAAGQYVAIVNPTAARNGKSVYKDFGFDLSNAETLDDGSNYASDLSSAGFETAVQAKRFFVFGIGPNSSWIGSRKSGIQEAPECKIVKDGEYNRYFLVVAMPAGPNDMNDPYPAGVLDSTGKTARGAASWATRTE